MEWSASSTASSIVFPYHFICLLIINLFLFCYFQYENEVKIISKWTNNKLTRPRFSDAAGEVRSSSFNPFFRAVFFNCLLAGTKPNLKAFFPYQQLELPQDKFIPPEGWKFEGGWQKKPELRYYSRLPITRTFKGTRNKFELSGAQRK